MIYPSLLIFIIAFLIRLLNIYFSNGEVWSNSWFTWSGVGKTTGEEYTNRAHFDYKWENGKIVELLAYYSEYADLKESAALQATQE